MNAVSAISITKRFADELLALNNLELQVQSGEVVGIIGANGSGKSTLLKVLFGELRPDSGSVRTLGLIPSESWKSIREMVGYVPQHLALDLEMTGEETLSLFCTLFGLSGDQHETKMAELAELFGLSHLVGRRVSTYSGGNRQRLHLAISMIHESRLLLLDEPNAALDPEGRALFWDVIRARARQEKTMIVATHDLDEAARYCDRIAFLSQGTVIAIDSPQKIISSHGTETLEITLEQGPRDWPAVKKSLLSMTEIMSAKNRHDQIHIFLKKDEESVSRIISVLTQSQLDVTSYHRRRPDLASAYFQLAGQDLVIRNQQESDRGTKRRRS